LLDGTDNIGSAVVKDNEYDYVCFLQDPAPSLRSCYQLIFWTQMLYFKAATYWTACSREGNARLQPTNIIIAISIFSQLSHFVKSDGSFFAGFQCCR
jgi:hypothetical protein